MRTISAVEELIGRRRRQILVHSCLYYYMDTNLITDSVFDRWCVELVALTAEHPEIAEKCVYHDAFEDFEGSTGVFLPYDTEEIIRAADTLLLVKRMGRI